jgi:DNA-directed RNA polymerase subunit F
MKDFESVLESSLVEELRKSIDSEILKRVMSMAPTRSEKIRSILKKLNDNNEE